MSAFLGYAGDGSPLSFDELYSWSVMHPEEFWPAVWSFCGVVADKREGGAPWDEVVRGLDRMAPPDPGLGPHWFVGARLNFAENLLRYRDDRDAIVAWNEQGRQSVTTYGQLYQAVAHVAAALKAEGVGVGDRVAGFIPNVPESVIAMLAAVSLGATWSSCSPDFGVQGVIDRFGQIEPKVLFCADEYTYAGKRIDTLGRVAELAERIPSIERIVVVASRGGQMNLSSIRNAVTWEGFAGNGRDNGDDAMEFEQLPFDHPLYILYSSGTTGLPKCMVHGAGGTLLQHLKEHILHTDLGRDDRVFYFTTCGWMMWNWLVSALAVGSTIVLYDGAPFSPRSDSLWEMAESERITVFGTSAKYLAMCEKHGDQPGAKRGLSALRTILSTGSPLSPQSFDYVYENVKADVHLASISGGTDIVSCFAGGNPVAPVYRGELQTRALGMAVHVFNDVGRPVIEEPGELVCTRPFPSMPVAFWNDPDGAKYRAAYFEKYPNVWRHGDWSEITRHNGMIIHGRSDATLNPGGVRIGTAEIYRQVERIPEVLECVAIGKEIREGLAGDVEIVLFVRLGEGERLDDSLRSRIRQQIRDNTSPLHVPKNIIQVSDIPRTVSGKISEMAVREAVHGRPVPNEEALANPEALKLFERL
ncbi:MAG: acetoacetate--CoA ligase [Gemmatimonadaceae bacterium]|nr:acetoacetate--CoA ligase [Gemmatimonadaceae bacterium]